MRFYKISSTSSAAKFLADKINKNLSRGKKVLWLIPGGSSAEVAIATRNLMNVNLDKLTVTLTDERYGKIGHKDSNWQQLKELGFDFEKIKTIPVLDGESIFNTTHSFSMALAAAFKESDYKIGFFGIGADGHTAGILPASPAVNEKDFAAGYIGSDFKRITMTFHAIKDLDEVAAYTKGEAKWPILDQLEQKLPPAKQPAQIFKELNDVFILNDYKGEKL